jgi:hypothetical protein
VRVTEPLVRAQLRTLISYPREAGEIMTTSLKVNQLVICKLAPRRGTSDLPLIAVRRCNSHVCRQTRCAETDARCESPERNEETLNSRVQESVSDW